MTIQIVRFFEFIKILTIVILISGCYSTAAVPAPGQEEFILKLRRLSSELDSLTNQRGGKDGKLQDRDLEDRIVTKKNEIYDAFHVKTPNAILWNANIDRLERKNENIIIFTSYKEQYYELTISAEKAKNIIEASFARGDKIRFSGALGPEQSTTMTGAFFNPEFNLSPTTVQKGPVEVTQP